MSGIELRFSGPVGPFRLDVSFACPVRGITALTGPSGCGKTTTLRCLAGLAHVADGFLNVNGDIWQDKGTFLPAHKRPLGYVFQEARLFAHLSVTGNLRYGLERSGGARGPDFDAVVNLLKLAPLLTRAPQHLSGGERQRVALGRALLSAPRLLLMDEPLSALDHSGKREILSYIETLSKTCDLPILYVSHDIAEIERLADRVVLMEDGRVRAVGLVEDVLTDLSLPLARRAGAGSVLMLTVDRYDAAYDMTECRAGDAVFWVPGCTGPPGSRCRVQIQASDVSLISGPPVQSSILNVLPARIAGVEQTCDNQMMVVLALTMSGAEHKILAGVTRLSWDRLNLSVGDKVYAQIKGVAVAGNA